MDILGSGIGQMNDTDRALNGEVKTSGFDIGGIFNNSFFSSPQFSNLTGALGAANGIFSAWSGYNNTKKALKEQKRMNNLLERQLNIENQRYDTELKKRDDAHKTIADSASLFQADPQGLFERQ